MEVSKQDFYKDVEAMVGMPIADDTLFFDDVGLDGFDAENIMLIIFEKYHVNFDSYNSDSYHLSDTQFANFFLIIYWRLFNRSKLKKKNFSALHLYKVVEKGEWFEPE